MYKKISIGVNEILLYKSVSLFYFILKLGMIKVMSGLIEIPILKKSNTKTETTFNSSVTALDLS